MKENKILQQQCYKCDYVWNIRTEKPLSCPRCKTRFDYVFKETIKPKKDNIVIQDQKDFEANEKQYKPKEDY